MVLTIAALLTGCGERAAPGPPQVTRVGREGGAVAVSLDRALALVRAERLGAEGTTPRQVWTFTPGPRRMLRLEPPPPPGSHRLRLVEASKRDWIVALSVPPPPASGLRARLEVPLGSPAEDEEVWLPAGAPATLGLVVDCELDAPAEAQVDLSLPREFGPDLARARDDGWTVSRQGDAFGLTARLLLRPGDRIQRRLEVSPEAGAGGKAWRIQARLQAAGRGPVEFFAAVRCESPEALSRFIRVERMLLPTDRLGLADPTRRADAILMPTHLGRWLRGLAHGPAPTGTGEEPFTWQAVSVANNSSAALAVEVRSVVRQEGSLQPAEAFAPPPALGGSGLFVMDVAVLPPRSARSVVLPVFVRPDVLTGQYARHVELRLLGSQAVVAACRAPLRVEQTDRPPLYVTLLAVLMTAIALPWLVLRARAILGRFTNTELIRMALFGAAALLLVGVPSRLLAIWLNALLPVLSPFLLGVYSQTASAAILGSLVVLAPRPGVALLTGGVRFLLNGVLFGAFSPVDFLYMIPALLACEAALWATGVTRSSRASRARLALAFVLLGLAGAGLELALEMTLYRLFFADWYIVLFLLLNGALYPGLGGVLGWRLGAALKRTAE